MSDLFTKNIPDPKDVKNYTGIILNILSYNSLEIRKCFYCGCQTNYQCSECKFTYYCSRNCQKKDRDFHKPVCTSLRKIYTEFRRNILSRIELKKLTKFPETVSASTSEAVKKFISDNNIHKMHLGFDGPIMLVYIDSKTVVSITTTNAYMCLSAELPLYMKMVKKYEDGDSLENDTMIVIYSGDYSGNTYFRSLSRVRKNSEFTAIIISFKSSMTLPNINIRQVCLMRETFNFVVGKYRKSFEAIEKHAKTCKNGGACKCDC